ncbi:DHA2 family efflux MFS transporter permease subunit [Alicyclobacillus sp. ALC3]|uniref:DHA2 family efflux MFS transporter permease subunit n=1 Tax=Alicyclobacillus sp. ALC3 TaxID=2796143 RepID=UPI002379E7C0|nr:DHA2 family efflux MFS transporter permease subunit [Alicyclobacillus sp. ALC3]WDL98342.1 DHA2 family efflux MFS transporter permease subunit [Alicyclobacillus sp. ALC3]
MSVTRAASGEPVNRQGYRWVVFATVVSGTFMVNVDSSIMNVTLPVLERNFHVGPEVLQWVISAYLLMITGILPVVGSLSDRQNRKTVFIIGVGIFTLGSILCAFSDSITQLILFRILQSVGGAVIMGNVMSIVSFIFPEGQRGRPLGIVGSVVAAGTIVGPSLGGILISIYSWRSVFWVNVPIGIVSIIVAAFVLSPIRSSKQLGKFDIPGASMFFVGIVSLMLCISEGTTWGWGSAQSLLLTVLSVLALAAFIWRELKTQNPVIDLSFFRSGAFTLGNLTGYLSYVMMMFPGIVLPLYMHDVLRIPTAHIGLLLTPQALSMIIFSPIGGWMADKFGVNLPAAVGLLLGTAGLSLMAALGIGASYWQIVFALTVFGLGMGLFTSPNNVSVLESVPVEKSGLTGSLMATVRNFGRVSGVAMTVLFLQMSGSTLSTMRGFSQASSFTFKLAAGIGMAGILLTMIRWTTRPRMRKTAKANL